MPSFEQKTNKAHQRHSTYKGRVCHSVDWVELVSRCFCVNRPRKDFLSHKYSSAKEIISGDTASSSDGRRDYYERVELGGIDEEEEDPQCILKAAPKGRFLVLFFKPHPHSG